MKCECLEVQQLLKVLLPKVESCNEPLKSQAVGNALYGLRNMKCECLEVQQLLKVLLPKAESCNEPLKAQEVGNALYGLQSMNSDNIEVQHILKVLAPQIQSCTQPLDVQAVGNALYGLQNMSSNNAEVQHVLKVLVPKIQSCTQPLNAQAVGNVLYGLQNMKDVPPGLIQYIEDQLHYTLTERMSTKSLHPLDFLYLYQSIVLISTSEDQHSSPLFKQLSDSGQKIISNLKAYLKVYTNGSEMLKFMKSRNISRSETSYVNKMRQELMSKYPIEFSNGEAVIETNVLLYGFECGMIFRLNGQPIINYEIDGSSHNIHSKKRFCKKRDDYLTSVHGVKIIRLNARRYK